MLPPQSNDRKDQNTEDDNCRDDEAERRMATRSTDGTILDELLKFLRICWMTAIAWADVLVTQFKAFRTATATVAVG